MPSLPQLLQISCSLDSGHKRCTVAHCSTSFLQLHWQVVLTFGHRRPTDQARRTIRRTTMPSSGRCPNCSGGMHWTASSDCVILACIQRPRKHPTQTHLEQDKILTCTLWAPLTTDIHRLFDVTLIFEVGLPLHVRSVNLNWWRWSQWRTEPAKVTFWYLLSWKSPSCESARSTVV